MKCLEHEDSSQTVGIKVFLALQKGPKSTITTVFPGYNAEASTTIMLCLDVDIEGKELIWPGIQNTLKYPGCV